MKPPTYYVLEPRNESCRRVNPMLWNEFAAKHGSIAETGYDLYTEAICVQWLDQFYENMGEYGIEKETDSDLA